MQLPRTDTAPDEISAHGRGYLTRVKRAALFLAAANLSALAAIASRPRAGGALALAVTAATCAALAVVARRHAGHVAAYEREVAARAGELAEKNAELRLLLDHASQGFASIDPQGRLAPERSAAFDRWFGAPAAGSSWFDCLQAFSPEFALCSRVGWDEVAAGVMPAEVTLEQMPRRLATAGRHLLIEYRPIGGADAATRYLVVASDITAALEREQANARQADLLAMLGRVQDDRPGVAAFLAEADELVDTVNDLRASLSAVRRALHTLKGNAALYGVASVASLCEEIEGHIDATGDAPPPALTARLTEDWARITRDVERMMGRRDVIELEEDQYAALVDAVRRCPDHDAPLALLRQLRLEPSRRRLAHFAELATQIADRLGKRGLAVRVEDNGVRLVAKRWRGFWGALVHAVRNAVGHGIEAPDERAAKGKPAGGALLLRTAVEGDRLVVEVEDDGRGVDWERVRELASGMGLRVSSPDALEDALFADRLSTMPEVTDLSGRGVGLGALLDATRALGGELTVRSAPDVGTAVRMTFPLPANRPLEVVAPAA
jgi:two-component system chemotaxis sensor kinase CheA